MKTSSIIILSFFIIVFNFSVSARSILRPKNPYLPEITAQWENSPQTYSIRDSHLEEYPLFVIKANKKDHVLPENHITFRHDKEKSVKGRELQNKIEKMYHELISGKKTFSDFEILQTKNFSWKHQCGLIVLKFKEYPFVVKLFMERPKTFVNPYNKGAEPIFFFYMGRGTNRHIAGLTRPDNAKNIIKLIADHPYWKDHVLVPRKWLWTPKNVRNIILTGKNIAHKKILKNTIPSVYAIVADEFKTETTFHLTGSKKRKLILDFCNDMKYCVDPHAKNFIFHKHPKKNDAIMVIIDTEHMPTLVGMKEDKKFSSLTEWYMYLVGKGVKDFYLRNKNERLRAQTKTNHLALLSY